jgi:DNA-binding response OmpR family regulator
MGKPKVLIVEDDVDMRDTLACYLAGEGFDVAEAADGTRMWEVLDDATSLVLMDLNLPGEDGFALARAVRARSDMGIIMITGRGDLIDRVVGLELGADDYLAKPFELRELLARIRAVLRRSSARHAPAVAEGQLIRFEGWELDVTRRLLTDPDGKEVALTSTEFAILHLLASPPGRTISRQQLYETVMSREWSPLDRSIDVHVGNLRKKLEVEGRHPRLIKTVHGIGYVLAGAGAS